MNNSKTISDADLSRKMAIFFDIKKVISYRKSTGKWYYHSKDVTSLEEMYGPFDSFLDAVNDAIEPYENPED